MPARASCNFLNTVREPMTRSITLLWLLLFPLITMAENGDLYQVDLLIFANTNAKSAQIENLTAPLVITNHKSVTEIATSSDSATNAYKLLKNSASHLQKEKQLLLNSADYQLLFQYSWLQPLDGTKTISLPQQMNNGWDSSGFVRVVYRNHYYQLDTDINLTPPDSKMFILAQNKRLKDGTLYYLDHPTAGILVKISKVS